MNNAGNTPGFVENGRKAEQLVGEADELLATALAPGNWPSQDAVDEFLAAGKLDQVLALYGRAMRLEAEEASYPWNLASAMNRLGLNDLALGFLSRAIHLAERRGESEWSGPSAQLALAEVAMDAGEYDIALTALAHAQEADDSDNHGDDVQRLLLEIGRERRDPKPQVSLMSLLERLPA